MDALIKGRFSIYETGDGGIHLAFRLDGDSEDRHAELNRAMVRMMRLAANGKDPLAMLRGMTANG